MFPKCAWCLEAKKLLSVRAYLAIGEILLDGGRPDEAVTGLEQAYALLKRLRCDELLCIETDEVMSTQEDEADLDFREKDDDEEDDDEDWDPDESVEGKRLQHLL